MLSKPLRTKVKTASEEVIDGTFTIPEAVPRKSQVRTGLGYVPVSLVPSNEFLRLPLVESICLAGKRVYSFASVAWRHNLLVLTEERQEKQIA
jgi:hypothetical protein